MKKILLFIAVLFTIYCQAQTVVDCKPGAKQIGSPTLDTLAADTCIYFRFTSSVSAYSIQLIVVDTIEGADVGVRLYGSNYIGGVAGETLLAFTQIGSDSLKMTDDVLPFPAAVIFTGTTFPYGIGMLKFTDITAITEGEVRIVVYSYE